MGWRVIGEKQIISKSLIRWKTVYRPRVYDWETNDVMENPALTWNLSGFYLTSGFGRIEKITNFTRKLGSRKELFYQLLMVKSLHTFVCNKSKAYYI